MDSSVVAKRVFFLLFFLFLFTYTTFKFYVSDSMAAARTALGIALVSKGSIQIDDYSHFTNDSTFRGGHHYACQAPGSSLLSLPTIALAYYFLKAVGKDDFMAFDSRQPEVPSQTFGTVMLAGSLVVSFFAALGAAMIYVLGIHFGVSQRTAVFIAVFFGLGTPYAMWATVLMGHALAGAFLVLSFVWGEFLVRSNAGPKSAIPDSGWVMTGFLLAFSVNIEYTAAIPAVVLGLTFLALLRRANLPWSHCIRTVFLLVLGAIPAAALFFVYNTLAFGSPLSLGYLQVSDVNPLMSQGFAGVALPKFSVLFRSLFSPRFGILWFSPTLVLFPFAVYENLRRGFQRELNVACLLIVSYYFLLNASYGYWFHSLNGPRHVTAALPFAFLPFLFLEQWSSTFLRRALWILGSYSLTVFSFAMFVPMSEIYWREYSKIPSIVSAFFRGEIRNLFYYAGLPVPVAMILPFLIWGTFGFLLWRAARQI